MVLKNEGGKYGVWQKWEKLGLVSGAVLSDLDGDGKEDVLVSQNFYGVNREMSRCDAGRGLWMRGTGKGI